MTVKEDPKNGKLELFYEDRLVASHQKARKEQRIVVEEHVKELLRPRWDRLPKRKIPTPDSGRPRIPNASPLVPWPDLSVETRAVPIYQALAEGGRS